MKIMNKYAREFIVGVVLALLTISFILMFPKQKILELLVILLAVIASIYLGFALSDGRKREIMIEISGMFFFLALAIFGLWISPYFLIAGYLIHGVWDVIHNHKIIQTEVVEWYKILCLVYDWVIAIFILLWL